MFPNTWCCQFKNFSHSGRCVVISPCGFHLLFPNDQCCCSCFQVLVFFYLSSLVKCHFKSFSHLKKWADYLSEYQSFERVYFAIFFLPICGCLFIFLRMSFKEPKFKMLMKYHLPIFSICVCSKKFLPNPKSQRFSLHFLPMM